MRNLFLGNNLRNIRTYCGLTQYDVSNYLNIDQMHISGYETNYASIGLHELVNFSLLFNISINDILKNNYKASSFNIEFQRIQKFSKERIEKIGYVIFEARMASGLTLKQSSEILRITKQTLSRYEEGIVLPGPKNLIHICILYDLNIDEIIQYYKYNKMYINNSIKNKIVEIIQNNKKLSKKELILLINQFLLKELNYYKNPIQVLNDMQPELKNIIKEIETQI